MRVSKGVFDTDIGRFYTMVSDTDILDTYLTRQGNMSDIFSFTTPHSVAARLPRRLPFGAVLTNSRPQQVQPASGAAA